MHILLCLNFSKTYYLLTSCYGRRCMSYYYPHPRPNFPSQAHRLLQRPSLQCFTTLIAEGVGLQGSYLFPFRRPIPPHLFSPSSGRTRCLHFKNGAGTASAGTSHLANEFWLFLPYFSASEILLISFLRCNFWPILLLLLAYIFKCFPLYLLFSGIWGEGDWR